MKQRTRRQQNDALRKLTKLCNRPTYLFLTILFSLLTLETNAKVPLPFPGWLSLSSFDQSNAIWYDSNPSTSPQLILKIDPPSRNQIHVYGLGKETDTNRSQTFLTGPSGYIGIDGYVDGSTICFVILRNGFTASELSWFEQCHILDTDEHSQESLDIDINSLVDPTVISLKLQSSLERPHLLMNDLPLMLKLTSPTHFDQIDQSFANYQHHAYATLIGDHNGKIRIKSNKKLEGSISTNVHNFLQSEEAEFNLENKNLEVNLMVDCKITPENPQIGNVQSWTQSLGWFPTIPSTVEEAVAQNWRKINKVCDDIKQIPGFRYENLNDPSKFGLVLIFDYHDYLTGIQIAIPKDLVQENGIYDYESSPYYFDSLYGNEPAHAISLYFDDREDVCREKNHYELLCDPALRQKSFLLTKTSEIPIFKNEKNALENGWFLQRRFRSGNLLSPYDYNLNRKTNDLPPYLAFYKEGELNGLSLIHFVKDALNHQFKDTLFEMDNPSDLYINPPETLNASFYDMKALQSNFYIGSKVAREFAHRDDSFYYIQVKDNHGRGIEGAVIKLKNEEKVRAAQLSTDRHGKAFIVFDDDVYHIEFELEPSNRKISDGLFWKPDHQYKLHRSHHKQTVYVETITKATVNIDVNLDTSGIHQFRIWTDKSHGKSWTKSRNHNDQIEKFYVDLDVSQIHILGYDEEAAVVTYHILKIDNNREVKGHHGLDIYADIKSHHEKSILNVKEIQSDKGLSGAKVVVEIGTAHHQAQKFKFQTRSKNKNSVYFDVPEGILIGWHVYQPRYQTHSNSDTAITPFKETTKLLKMIDINVHICLSKYEDIDENGSEKDAVVESILEYEWASQDDSHEIVPVDYKGDIKLQKIPSPSPGERLNITLLSRLGSQIFFDGQNNYHRNLAEHFSEIGYEEEGPVHLRLCHQQETVVVVVSNGVSHWKMDKVTIKLRPENDDAVSKLTNEDGAAFFSFDYEIQNGQKFYLDIEKQYYDSVQLTRYIHSNHRKTQIIQIDLYPQKHVKLYVSLNSHHYHRIPAIGAVVDWTAEDDGGIVGVNGDGMVELELSGKSETIHEMTISIPWQTTCGSTKHGNRPLAKEIYGAIKVKNQNYPLSHRPPFLDEKFLTLPKLTQIHYELELHDFFPDNVELHTDLLEHETIKIEDSIYHDKVKFTVDIGSTKAFLFLEEHYSSKIVLTSLEPCFTLDSDSWEHYENQIMFRQSVYHKTVKVIIKMVDKHLKPFTNATLHYIFGETALGYRSTHANSEDGEIQFHLPEDMLVHISTDTIGGRRGIADLENPTHFVAKEGLVLHLMFGGGSRYLTASVALIGEGFNIPEGHPVRYIAKDWAGDEEKRGVELTKFDGTIEIEMTLDTAFVDFSIGGSDGFDPLFFQPFEYIYNISYHHDIWNHDEPLQIEIPVKSVKNVIVSVKDCFTGELIQPERKPYVEFPPDSYVPHSWYDRNTMENRYSAVTDDQGMAFFLLEPDLMIPIHISAHGYKKFNSIISVASNVTHLVEANLCKFITVKVKLVDKERHNQPVHHSKIAIEIDHHEAFEITTDDKGYATFDTSTQMKHLALRVVDANESIEKPVFELEDDQDYIKNGDVDIDIKEREYTIDLEAASCTGFKQYSNVPVLIKIDEYEFVRTSDEHGRIAIRVRESAKSIIAKVMPHTNDFHTENNHHSIGLMPVEDLPKRFNFKFISSPVLLKLKLFDNYNRKKPVAHATCGISLNDESKFIEIITDREGNANFQIPPTTYSISLQVLDMNEDIIQPVFEIYDECSDFMDSNDIKIETLERMYTIDIATGNCHNFHHVKNVPVLVHIGYDDDMHHHRHLNIHEDSKHVFIGSPHGYDHRKHLAEYILTSNSNGLVKLRIHESAANVTLTVLSPPDHNKDIMNLGLLAKDELPERFDFVFYALPKELAISVRDSKSDQSIYGAEVQVKYYDQATDHHVMKTEVTDHFGKALLKIDGCTEFASFTVSPPLSLTGHCQGGIVYQVEKRQHWNVMKDQKFKIALKSRESNHHTKEVTVRSKINHIDEMKYSYEGQKYATEMGKSNPFFKHWNFKTKTQDKKRIILLTISKQEHIMGITSKELDCTTDHIYIDIFENSIEVQINVENEHGHRLENAEISWHLGHGLGKAKVHTNSYGKAHIYAPLGHLLALESKGHGCHSRLTIDEAHEGQSLILICKN